MQGSQIFLAVFADSNESSLSLKAELCILIPGRKKKCSITTLLMTMNGRISTFLALSRSCSQLTLLLLVNSIPTLELQNKCPQKPIESWDNGQVIHISHNHHIPLSCSHAYFWIELHSDREIQMPCQSKVIYSISIESGTKLVVVTMKYENPGDNHITEFFRISADLVKIVFQQI